MKFRLLLIAFFVLILGSVGSYGQATLYSENFGTTNAVLPTGWTSSNTTNGWNGSTASVSNTYPGFSAGANAVFNGTGTNGAIHTLTYANNLSTVGYSSITVLWGGRGTTAFNGAITFQWSPDGTTWNTVAYTYTNNANAWALVNGGVRIALPVGAEGISNLRFRWSAATTNSGNYRIDDFTVQGTVSSCTAPTTQASNITFSAVAPTTMSVNWTNGNGTGRVVKMNTSNSFTAPTDGSLPAASTAWANAGEQVVYAGTGSGPINITGLSASTTYWYRVYEYCTAGNVYQSATATNNPNSQATAAAAFTTTANGDWYTGSTWIGGIVPTAGQNVIINHAVTSTAAITRDAGTTTTINTSSSLAVSATYTNNGTTTVNGTFQLNTGGYANGTNFIYGASGTLVFNSSSNYGVNNTDVFWPSSNTPFNVSILQGGMTMNATTIRSVAGTFSIANAGVTITSPSTLTINGTCLINAGGFFNNSPIYGASSLLKYNTSGIFGRGFEWQAAGVGTIGVTAGYPNHVQVSNTTTIDYINGAASGAVGIKAMAGNLTIDSGSALHMNYGSVSAGGALIVAGNVAIAGTLTLGQSAGDDLKVTGNFTNTGTFNGNARAVYFTKTGTQVVTSSSILTIPYLVTTGTGTTVQLAAGTSLILSAPNAGNALSFGNAADIIDINGNTLTIGSAAIANVINGSGSLKGSASSNLTLLGTGSVGTLNFTTGFQNLNNFTIDRQAATVAGVLGSSVTINGILALTNGIIDLGNNVMTIGSTGSISNASSTNFIIADLGNGSNASLRKSFTAAGTFAFPIGDRAASADGMQYSPVSVTFTGGSYAGYAGFAVDDIKHPNMDSTTFFISRYWSMTSSGLSPTIYSVTGSYLAVDINGAESSSLSNQWDGTAWTNGGAPIGGNTMIIGGCTALPATNHFSAGQRDREINIVQGATTYLTGSTYNFGTVLTTSPIDVTFTIQNTGQLNLALGASPTVAGAAYSLVTNYASTTVPPISGSTPGTRTFVIRFTPSGAGTFTGSVTIASNDADEPSYVINFTGVGVVPAPEINIQGLGITIAPGNTPVGTDNTLFAAQNIGSTSAANTFTIQNLGTAALVLSGSSPYVTLGGANPGDFAVSAIPSNSVGPSSSTTFSITFSPTATGIRDATVTVVSNDSDEGIYTFNISGDAFCVGANTITPTSGPVGTEVTITATTNNLTGATVTFLGAVATSVTYIDATHIKAIIPSAAVNGTGTLTTTNSLGCVSSNIFTVDRNIVSACEGSANLTELFISEVTDATYGGLTYVEIYNRTGSTVNLANYSLQFFANGNSSSYGTQVLSGTIANGATYIVATSLSGFQCGVSGGDGSLANLSSLISGINFDPSGNDHIGLYNGATKIDSWGTYMNSSWANSLGIGDRGVDFRRKNNVTLPNVTYSNSDWDIIDWGGTGTSSCSTNDYSNIGSYNYLSGTVPPTVTQHPSYTPTCRATSMTVAGTEGYVGGNPLAYQWYAVAPNTATWTALTNTGVYTGSTTATLTISDISGLVGYQYYCQIRENTSTCYSSTNAVMITAGQSTTWQAGNTWSNGSPTINTAVVINNNYDTSVSGSFEACSVTVNNGFTLDIKSGTYVSINNDLTVNTSGTLLVQNNGSLVMISDTGVVTNNGTTQVLRTTTPYERYDYTYWSSPVNNANITSTFTGWRTDYSFEFNTANFSDVRTINSAVGDIAGADSFDDYAPWAWLASTGAMINGKGYAIMGPTSVAFTPTATSTVTFSGKVNNGVVTIPVTESANASNTNDDYNLIGNPYPSSIFADTFITTNGAKTSGTLYFWTHVGNVSASNPGPDAYNFISDDYAVYNMSGGTRASLTGSSVPTGYIASGQGFFVEAQGNNTLTFNNAMRNKTYSNSNFYRTSSSSLEKDRIWLNLQNADGMFGQQLIAYFDEASLDFDWAYDGRVNQSNNYVSFYSIAGDEKYKIQARPTFTDTDIVPLGYFSAVSGPFTISIDQKEGVLNADYTSIYLEDLDMNIIHDLKDSPYTFTTTRGRYENRFLLRYTNNSLSTPDFETLNNSVVVTTHNGQLGITSYIETIKDVIVYDVLGRQLFEAKGINTNTFLTSNISMSQQALIVKITLDNGMKVTRKIIL